MLGKCTAQTGNQAKLKLLPFLVLTAAAHAVVYVPSNLGHSTPLLWACTAWVLGYWGGSIQLLYKYEKR